jgi:hypothetical protein
MSAREISQRQLQEVSRALAAAGTEHMQAAARTRPQMLATTREADELAGVDVDDGDLAVDAFPAAIAELVHRRLDRRCPRASSSGSTPNASLRIRERWRDSRSSAGTVTER